MKENYPRRAFRVNPDLSVNCGLMLGVFAVLALGGVLWGLWLLLWRRPDWPVVLAGCVFPLGLWLARRTGRAALAVPSRFFRVDLWLFFLGFTFWRVILSVTQTAWAAVTGKINPGVVAVPLRVRTEMAQLLLLWAITVTPGTIGLLAEGDILYVHCLYVPPGAALPGVDRLQDILARIWG